MKLFGLKNEAGEEVILHSFVGKDDHTRYIGDVEIVKKPPQFKVGDWIAFDDYRKIFYCTQIAGQYLNDGYKAYYIDYCSKATPQEIESHLKKICDEKGYKEGTKIRCMDKGNIRTLERPDEWFYNNHTDSFHGCTPTDEWDGGYSNPWIYHQGKFADIVPDKKKLPKTKAEFEDFLTQYYICGNIRNFLKDYFED